MNRLATALRRAAAGAAFVTASAAMLGAQDVEKSKLHDFRIVTVVDSLISPWGFAFLPGGDILVTQRGGAIRLIRGGKLRAEPVAGAPTVRVRGQGGLLDIVLHPRFAENKFVYITYSKPSEDGTQAATALMRARWDGEKLVDGKDLFVANNWSAGAGHFGSRLAFDRDGFLFMTTGDRQVPPTGDLEHHPAQDLSLDHGKTLRFKDDGTIPADNPFVNTPGARPEIWSYGHRNMQGITVHPQTNQVWTIEHGPQGGDELNLDQAGKNYGWPVIGFGVNYRSGLNIHTGTTREGMEQPVNIWVPSIAVEDLFVYTGDRFPEWRGSFFVGAMVGEKLVRVSLDGTKVLDVENLVQRRGRIRSIQQGPDGLIYLAFEDASGGASKLVKLEPVARR